MSPPIRGRGLFEDHWNTTFWLLFVVAAAMFVIQLFINRITPIIFAGLIVILVGVYALGSEYRTKRIGKVLEENTRKVDDLNQWANKSYDYTRSFKDRHESLIFNTNLRMAESEDKAKGERDALAKKLLEIENGLNKFLRDIRDKKAIEDHYKLVKPVLEKEAPARIERPQAVSVDIKPPIVKPKPPEPKPQGTPSPAPRPERTPAPDKLSDLNLRQSSSLDTIRKKGKITNKEYAEMFSLTNKTAYRDLNKMVKSGLLRRRGKGRNTSYVLAF